MTFGSGKGGSFTIWDWRSDLWIRQGWVIYYGTGGLPFGPDKGCIPNLKNSGLHYLSGVH